MGPIRRLLAAAGRSVVAGRASGTTEPESLPGMFRRRPGAWWGAPADPAHPAGATNGQAAMMGPDHHPACHHYELGRCTCSDLETRHLTAGRPRAEADRIRVAWALRGACESGVEARYVSALGRRLSHWPGNDGELIRAAVAAAIGDHPDAQVEITPIRQDDPAFHGVHQTLYAVNNALVYAVGDLGRRWEMTAQVEEMIDRTGAP